MASGKLVRGGFVDSESVCALSDWAHRVYSNLLVESDDAGRFDGRVEVLRSRLFPLGTTRRSEDFEKALSEMCAPSSESDRTLPPLVIRYEFDGRPYLQLVKCHKYNRSGFSEYPWKDGSRNIEYVMLPTRSGMKPFVKTSIPESMGSLPGGDGIVMGSATDTDTSTDTDTTANGVDPANKLASDTGLAMNIGPKQCSALRSLIAIDGYESAKDGIQRALRKGIGGGAAITWAEKNVAGRKAERELRTKAEGPTHQPVTRGRKY